MIATYCHEHDRYTPCPTCMDGTAPTKYTRTGRATYVCDGCGTVRHPYRREAVTADGGLLAEQAEGGGMNKIIFGDCRTTMRQLASDGVRVQTCVTSPPYYWQRDYGVEGQMGMEETPAAYVEKMVEVFRCVRDLLADDGTLWLNIGDSYYSGNGQPKGYDPRSPSRNWMRQKVRPLDVAGLGVPKKSLLGIPWMVAHALQRDGWTIRADIIWCRDTAFPEPSVKDRPHRQHEYLFLLSRSRWYHFDRDALPEESVWHIPHERACKGHSAAFPAELVRRCIIAGSRPGDIVLDPFMGSGTTAAAAVMHGRQYIGCELNPAYEPLQQERIKNAFNALPRHTDMFGGNA